MNRTLQEMWAGIVFWGILCQIVGAFFVEKQGFYAMSLWFGIILAIVSSIHMYQSLDRAFELDEKNAQKAVYKGYIIRYAMIVIIMGIIMVTGVLNPLVVFLAYMGLKVTAYLQPITHKIFNKILPETK